MSELCENQMISQDYADYIVEFSGNVELIKQRYGVECVTTLDDSFAIIHLPVESMRTPGMFAYNAIPKVYGLMDSSSMDASGITRIQNQPYLALKGSNILIGVVGTGVDYTHPVFREADGTTRIGFIWDQSIDTGPRPPLIDYGTEYSAEDINRALASAQPFDIVPSMDEDGHGTFMAGIAAGNADPANDFIGAAPEAQIAVVKLKQAKNYLRDYYLVPDDVQAFQETDIMMGIRYLIHAAIRLQKPLVIYFSMGTSNGDHEGNSYLAQYISQIGDLRSVCMVTACGNEGNSGTHYYGRISNRGAFEEVEVRVGSNEKGFVLELWGRAPDILSVAFTSPGGELIEKIQPRYGQVQTINFLLDPTEIYVMYDLVEASSGNQVIIMRFANPSSGVWRIRVYGDIVLYGDFHMWLPIRDFLQEGTYFLRPDPDTTFTGPSDAMRCICVTAYNHITNSIYVQASRGFTPEGRVIPDIAAPGVNVFGPAPGGGFTTKSGTSVGAAHVAGAAALLLEWGIYRRNNLNIDTTEVNKMLIRGARRRTDIVYPSRIWGFGELDLYNTFQYSIT